MLPYSTFYLVTAFTQNRIIFYHIAYRCCPRENIEGFVETSTAALTAMLDYKQNPCGKYQPFSRGRRIVKSINLPNIY